MAMFDRFRRRPEETDFSAPVEMTGGTDFTAPPAAPVEMTGMPDAGTLGVMAAEQAAMIQPIDKEQIRKAMQTLRDYMAGKAQLDRRLIENDKWWRQRHWDVIREKGTTPLQTKSAWLVNVVLSKHADAMDALPEPNVLPRAEDDREEARRLSKILPVVLDEAEFADAWEEAWWNKLQGGTGIFGVFWDKSRHNGWATWRSAPSTL